MTTMTVGTEKRNRCPHMRPIRGRGGTLLRSRMGEEIGPGSLRVPAIDCTFRVQAWQGFRVRDTTKSHSGARPRRGSTGSGVVSMIPYEERRSCAVSRGISCGNEIAHMPTMDTLSLAGCTMRRCREGGSGGKARTTGRESHTRYTMSNQSLLKEVQRHLLEPKASAQLVIRALARGPKKIAATE